jgi:hypothetical protein
MSYSGGKSKQIHVTGPRSSSFHEEEQSSEPGYMRKKTKNPALAQPITKAKAKTRSGVGGFKVKADSRKPYLGPQIPSELWAVVFQLVGQDALAQQPRIISGLRLLSRSITAGLDEWILQGIDQGVQRDGSLQLVPTDPSCIAASLPVQKRALLALTKAPKEFLLAIRKLEGKLLGGGASTSRASPSLVAEVTLNSLLSQLRNVSSIVGACCLQGLWLRILDLRSMTQLTTIGDSFLYNSVLDKLLLPRSLKSVGAYFLAKSSIKKIDLSRTSLETVGIYFLHYCKSSKVLFPPSLATVGHHFLVNSPVTVVDLSKTSLRTVGDYFLSFVDYGDVVPQRLVRLPSTLTRVGHYFLTNHSFNPIDLSSTSLVTVGNYFLQCAVSNELVLPDSLRWAGYYFLDRCNIERIDLSNTSLYEVGDWFLYAAESEELVLPPSLREVGYHFLYSCSIGTIDMSRTDIDFIVERFLRSTSFNRLFLPAFWEYDWDRYYSTSESGHVWFVSDSE